MARGAKGVTEELVTASRTDKSPPVFSSGGRFRRRKSRTPVPNAGLTIAGGNMAPASSQPEARIGGHAAVQTEGHAVTSDSQQTPGEITVRLFAPSQEPRVVSLDEVPDLIREDENFVWIDLSGYTEAEFRSVAAMLGLHRQGVRVALGPWQRPRLTIYPDHFFTCATVPTLDPNAWQVHASKMDLFVANNVFVSAHKAELPFADHLRARAFGSPELVQLDAAFMLAITLDELLAYYEELNRHIQNEIESMEERALHDMSDRFLEDLLHFKRYAFALSQLADQHREIFSAFLRPDFTWVAKSEVEEYFEDLDARLSRLLDLLLSAKDSVNGAFNIYVSHMSHRTNQVIKVLTLVSTVLFSATFVTGIFGTSISSSIHTVWLHTSAGLLVMLACVLTVSAGTLLTFHQRGWL